MITILQRHIQTDGQTDRQLALAIPRGKNRPVFDEVMCRVLGLTILAHSVAPAFRLKEASNASNMIFKTL